MRRGVLDCLQDYCSLLKPRQTLLLVYSGLCSMMAGGKPPIFLTIMVALALFLSIAGATVLTNYIDRDVDVLMRRTRNRPLPSNRIEPFKALLFGLILIGISLPIALRINILFLLFLLWGIINSAIIYNFWTKRRTHYNILLASPAGAMPVLGGWVAVRGVTLEPVLMAFLVILWIPIHVWSLALKWRNDYDRAAVPMLPLRIWGEKMVALFGVTLASYATFLTYLYPKFQSLHDTVTLMILNIFLVILSLNLAARPQERNAQILFKYTSPYIAIILLLWAW